MPSTLISNCGSGAAFDMPPVAVALQGPELAALREKHFRAHHRAAEAITALHLPHIPSREEFSAEAKAMFARSPSLDVHRWRS